MTELGKYGDITRRPHKNLKEMVEQGVQPVGMAMAIPSPFMAELAGVAGYDFVWLDLEHNAFNPETVCNIIRTADSCGMAVTARIAQYDLIAPLLDFGISGFTIPHMRSKEQAQEVIDLIKYAPVGRRGFCTGGRAQRYGTMPFLEYAKEADDEICLTVMIEDREGIAHAEEILSVPGIDFMTIGPGDFAQGMGHLDDADHPDVKAMMNKIYAIADQKGIKREETGAPKCIVEDKSGLLACLRNAIKEYRG